MLRPVRACLARHHRRARLAPGRVLEFQNRHPDFLRLELIENLLRIVGAVIIPHAGMIAPNDEMRDAVILADQRVQNRLARAGVTHRQRHHRQHRAVFVVIVIDQHLVTFHPCLGRDVVRFGLAHQRMNQQTIGHLQRALGQIFMRAMDRIARLKRRHRLPTLLLKRFARPRRRQAIISKFRLVRRRDHIDRPAQASISLLLDNRHARMRLILGAINIGNLQRLVVRKFLLDRHQPQQPSFFILQGHLLPDIDLRRHIIRRAKRHRNRPHRPIRQANILAHRGEIFLAHETDQRRKRDDGDHLQIKRLARRERD